MSVFKQILSLRDRFKKISDDNYDILTSIMTDDPLQGGYDYCQALNDKMLFSVKFDDQVSHNVITVTDNSTQEVVFSCDTADIGKYQDYILDTTEGLTLGNYLDQAGSSANLYSALSMVSGKYAYLNRQKYSDIVDIMNSSQIDGKNGFLTALGQASDHDGFVSNSAFFGVLKNYFASISEVLSGGSVELDQTNPYRFVSIFSMFAEVLTAIFDVLVMVLSGIARVIVGLLSIIFSLFKAAFNGIQQLESAEYDYDAGNDYLLGPMLAYDTEESPFTAEHAAMYGLLGSAPANYFESSTDRSRGIFLQEDQGVATFSWFIDPDHVEKGSRVNCYLYPYFDVRRIDFGRIFNTSDVSGTTFTAFTFNQTEVQDPSGEYYISLDGDLSNWPHYDDEHTPATVDEMVLSMAFGIFLRHVSLVKKATDLGIGTYGIWDITWRFNKDTYLMNRDASAYPPTSNNYYFYYRLLTIISWMTLYGNYDGAMSWKGFLGNYSILNFTDYLKSLADRMAQYMEGYVMPKNTSAFYGQNTRDGARWIDKSDTRTTVPPLCFPLCATKFQSYEEDAFGTPKFKFVPITFTYSPLTPEFMDARCLPCSFGLRLPLVSGEKLSRMLMYIGITVTVIAISAAVISVKVSKAQIAKRALQSKKISDAKEAYVTHPNNITLKENYQNLVWKYNFFGKVFGYGSYDGKNGWFEYNSGDSSEQFNKYDDFSANFESQKQSFTTTQDGIDTIIRLIHPVQD